MGKEMNSTIEIKKSNGQKKVRQVDNRERNNCICIVGFSKKEK